MYIVMGSDGSVPKMCTSGGYQLGLRFLVHPNQTLVLLTVFRYAEYHFVLVEKTKSANNIWEPVIVNVIILGFLMADTS